MQVHARAPLSPIGRRRVVARHQPRKTPVDRVRAICPLRRLHMTAAEIAEVLSMPLSTVSAVLSREGLGKRSRLTPIEPPNRYERRAAGELVHIDIKKLGRIVVPGHAVTGNRRQRADRTRVGSPTGRPVGTAGWEFVHVAIDDYSRLAYAEVLPDETPASAIAFLRRALAFFARHAITVERIMTDNGSAYRAHTHRLACQQLALKHLFTRPYRPRTNAKAERFPDPDTQLGSRTPLRQQRRAHRGTRRLAQPLQLHKTPRQPQPQAARLTTDQGVRELQGIRPGALVT